MGTDTASYMDGVYRVANVFTSKESFFEDNGGYEYLYYLVCVCIYQFNLPDRYIIFFFSTITFLFLYKAAKRYNINIAILLLFYVFTNMYITSMNVARQYAAISIMFYGTSFLTEHNWKRFLFFIWIIVGGLIHSSILTLLILYPCRFLSMNRKAISKYIFIFAFIAAVIPFYQVGFSILAKFNIEIFAEKYGEGSDFASYGFSVVGCVYKLIITFVYFMIFQLRNGTKNTDLFDNLFLVFIIVNAIFAYGNLGTFRYKMNFEIFSCLFLTICFIKYKNKCNSLFVTYFIVRSALVIKTAIEFEPYYMQFF